MSSGGETVSPGNSMNYNLLPAVVAGYATPYFGIGSRGFKKRLVCGTRRA